MARVCTFRCRPCAMYVCVKNRNFLTVHLLRHLQLYSVIHSLNSSGTFNWFIRSEVLKRPNERQTNEKHHIHTHIELMSEERHILFERQLHCMTCKACNTNSKAFPILFSSNIPTPSPTLSSDSFNLCEKPTTKNRNAMCAYHRKCNPNGLTPLT